MLGTQYPPDQICDFDEAAAVIGLSVYTVRQNWQREGMPFFWIGGRRAAFKDELLKWKANREATAQERLARRARA
jgi:hypothetical protein